MWKAHLFQDTLWGILWTLTATTNRQLVYFYHDYYNCSLSQAFKFPIYVVYNCSGSTEHADNQVKIASWLATHILTWSGYILIHVKHTYKLGSHAAKAIGCMEFFKIATCHFMAPHTYNLCSDMCKTK